MRQIRLPAFSLLAALALLSACAAPSPDGAGTTTTVTTEYATPDIPAEWGPGDYCANTNVIVTESERTNFSLGSENYRNNDYCAAYPYLKWLLATNPLFTGEDPDDRNFLRMAGVYEQFAQVADSSERRVWLDSALATRQQGRDAMDAAGVEYESYLRDLVEGFFYFSHSASYDDADHCQFDAFQRAFIAAPDSLEDWYLVQLLNGSVVEYGQDLPNPERADYVERLASYAERVGRPSSVQGRINYWCLADQYRQLGATTGDEAVAQGARGAASQYERSGPTREQIFFELNAGPGDGVACSITGGSTRVR